MQSCPPYFFAKPETRGQNSIKQARKMALSHDFCGIEHQKYECFTSTASGLLGQGDEGLPQIRRTLSRPVEGETQDLSVECEEGTIRVNGRNTPFSGFGAQEFDGIEFDRVGVIGVHVIDGALLSRLDRGGCTFWKEHLIRLHGLDPAEARHGMDFLRLQPKEREIREIEVGSGRRMVTGIARGDP